MPLDPDNDMFVNLFEFKALSKYRLFGGSLKKKLRLKRRLNKLTVIIKRLLLNLKRVVW